MATTTGNTPNGASTQPDGAKADPIKQIIADHTTSAEWSVRTIRLNAEQLRFLSRIGADRVRAMNTSQLQGLDETTIGRLADDILETQPHAGMTVENMSKKSPTASVSSAAWQSSKVSAKVLAGGVGGAAAGGVIALATRPINWFVSKMTGGRISFSAKSAIMLGALLGAGQGLFNGVVKAPLQRSEHNADVRSMSRMAIMQGIRDAAAERGAHAPGAPNQEPPSTGPGGSGNGPQGPRDGSPGPTGEGMQGDGNGSKPAGGHSATVAEIARKAGVAGRTRELVTGMEDVQIVEPPPKDEVGSTVVAQR